MLLLFIVCYFVLTLLIGVYAHRRIAGGRDFMNAGRSLNATLSMVFGAATWSVCYFAIDTAISPLIFGILASGLGALVGYFIDDKKGLATDTS